jgi:hypothetical protein
MADEGGFSRWSRRKRDTRAPRQEDATGPGADAPPPADSPARTAALTPGDEGESAPSAPDLPAVDDLDGESDYSPFMADGVPDELRQAALRKLWRSNPVFNVRDGLDDYDDDFTIIEAIKTVVGEARAAMDGSSAEPLEKSGDKEAAAIADGEADTGGKREVSEDTAIAAAKEPAEPDQSEDAAGELPSGDSSVERSEPDDGERA